MTAPVWHEEPISRNHDRGRFDCGEPALNEYLRTHARQNHERGAAKTFLAINDLDAAIIGYYSLCPASVKYSDAPLSIRKGLARHDVPAFRLARLAVDLKFQGQNIGRELLIGAGLRCLRAASQIGGVALLIDAKNDRVARWYASFGALPLIDSPGSLLLPLETIAEVLRNSGRHPPLLH